jgi:hypothetical protein
VAGILETIAQYRNCTSIIRSFKRLMHLFIQYSTLCVAVAFQTRVRNGVTKGGCMGQGLHFHFPSMGSITYFDAFERFDNKIFTSTKQETLF